MYNLHKGHILWLSGLARTPQIQAVVESNVEFVNVSASRYSAEGFITLTSVLEEKHDQFINLYWIKINIK